jgi:allose kinase
MEYIDRLARVIASEVNILDPELLILGGGVINMKDFPKEKLTKNIYKYVRKPLPHDTLKVEFSDGADVCGVIGAGISAWEKTN